MRNSIDMQSQMITLFRHYIRSINFSLLFLIISCREEYQNILTYNVPAERIKWSTVFGIMENAKKTALIEDYSISQNSLEQVILMFVKDQRDQRDLTKSKKDENTGSNEESMI